MKKKGSRSRKQGKSPALPLMHQLMLPLVSGIAATREGLLSFVHQMGLMALNELLAHNAEELAGPKGKRLANRTHHHWGSVPTELPFGGRKVVVPRPRVREKGGREVALPSLDELRATDPLSERVMEQIVLGVSTRGYERSLEPLPVGTRSRGTSKSSASRRLVERTEAATTDFLSRPLDELALVAMFIDGLVVGDHTVLLALGVTTDGSKVPLGLALGTTENAVACGKLIVDLAKRGLDMSERVLCVVDGGLALRSALKASYGDLAVIQRCQVHKMRNVADQVAKSRQAHVRRSMRDAYKSRSFKTALSRLRQLASWLDRNGEELAAASLREGMAETLTVLKLGLPPTLARTFATTNAIENLNGSVRRISRNVKRWRGTNMIQRWLVMSIEEAQRKFRRVKGHKDMPKLLAALRAIDAKALARDQEVA